MGRLYLLRHAKAQWPPPGTRDFDRPLAAQGVSDAGALGRAMAAAGYRPAKVLCSSARRARETWQAVAPHLGEVEVLYLDGLYSSDSTEYVALIRVHAAQEDVLVIGHNPMMEDLAVALSHDGAQGALQRVAAGFPPCALAAIRFPGALASVAPDGGHLEAFLTPRDL